jgi:hypothetical protein
VVLWIESPAGASSFKIGIFDGDSGRGNDGNINFRNGNWDDTETNSTYTLYADPTRDGTGMTAVGQWQANDPNSTADPTNGWWTASSETMPNNDWYKIIVKTVDAAENNGRYYYRFEATRPVEGAGSNAFKLRSHGTITSGRAELVDANFSLVGQLATSLDIPIICPDWAGDYTDCGPTTTYDGNWEFRFEVPAGTEALSLWDGDFDRGTTTVADEQDTDDLDTPPGLPDWAVADFTNPEGQGGSGKPADNASSALYRRGEAVQYSVIGPDGTIVFINDEPSGTEEWERFTVSSNPDIPADEYVDHIPAGAYTLKIEGLDLHNFVWFRMNYTIGEEECPECPICPDCPPTPECVVYPTETPIPPEPTPCPDPQPVDLLYVVDVSKSMDMDYYGVGSDLKIDAAKKAIKDLNDLVKTKGGSNSRVALISFSSALRGTGSPPKYEPHINVVSDFTTDIDAFNALVDGLSADRATPTAGALKKVAEWLPGNWNAEHLPVVILLTDGVPTVDLDTYYFDGRHVQPISLFNPDGTFRSVEGVRTSGTHYAQYGQKSGETLADAMMEAQNLKSTLPDVKVHSIAIQAVYGGVFNDGILRYVAAQTGGQFYTAEDTDGLKESLRRAYFDSACGEAEPPGDTGDDGGTGCDSLRVNQYNVENTTNHPFSTPSTASSTSSEAAPRSRAARGTSTRSP